MHLFLKFIIYIICKAISHKKTKLAQHVSISKVNTGGFHEGGIVDKSKFGKLSI